MGDINVGGDYGMRVLARPGEAQGGLTTIDVLDAIREQNVQVAAGQIGQPPSPPGQAYQLSVTTLGRLSDPEQFGDIIVKSVAAGQAGTGTVTQTTTTGPGDLKGAETGSPAARLTRVRDVARVERGGKVYDQWCDVGGTPAAGVAVYQLPGANALAVR
ncbi:MAG: efflux RND transporter permease subunit [Isosphaeraceae bacterium]